MQLDLSSCEGECRSGEQRKELDMLYLRLFLSHYILGISRIEILRVVRKDLDVLKDNLMRARHKHVYLPILSNKLGKSTV